MKYIFLILFLGGTLAKAQQQPYSMRQCIDYTLRNHPSVQVSDNNTRIAAEKARQSESGYLPQLSGSVNSIDNLKLQSTIIPAGIFGPEPTQVQLGAQYTTNAAIDLNQTIFDKGKIENIKANKPYREMTELQKQQTYETLTYNTASAFFQVLIYNEQLNILKANKAKYEEMVKVLAYQHEKGMVLEKDVDRIRVNLNTTNYQIEDAMTKERLAINTLKNTMGMPIDEELNISSNVNYEQFADNRSLDNLQLETLTEYKLSEKSVELQEAAIKIKQAAYLPTLSAVGKWGTQAMDNEFATAFDSWRGVSYVGLSLNMPLFNGFKRKSAVNEEKLKLNNEKANLNLNKQNLQLRFENAKTSAGTAYSSYRSNKENMELAKKLLGVTDYQYQRGVASLTDYLNDDIAYKSAQSNYINSLYNLMISRLNHQKSQGKLNEFINQLH